MGSRRGANCDGAGWCPASCSPAKSVRVNVGKRFSVDRRSAFGAGGGLEAVEGVAAGRALLLLDLDEEPQAASDAFGATDGDRLVCSTSRAGERYF